MANSVERIPVRRSARSVWPFFLALPVLGLGVALPLLTGVPHMAFAGGGFLLFFLVFFVFRTAAVFYRYGVDTVDPAIVVQNSQRRLRIPAREIRMVTHLNEQGVRCFLTQAYQPQMEIEQTREFTGWLSAARVYGYATEFLSVAVAQSVTTRGNRRNISSWHVRWFGEAVQIDRHHGISLLISPRESHVFVEKVKYLMIPVDQEIRDFPARSTVLTVKAATRPAKSEGGWNALRGRLRPTALLTLAVPLFLAAGVVGTFLAEQPGSFGRDSTKAPIEAPDAEMQIEWQNESTLTLTIPASWIPESEREQPGEWFYSRYLAGEVLRRCLELQICPAEGEQFLADKKRLTGIGHRLYRFGQLHLQDQFTDAHGEDYLTYSFWAGFMMGLTKQAVEEEVPMQTE